MSKQPINFSEAEVKSTKVKIPTEHIGTEELFSRDDSVEKGLLVATENNRLHRKKQKKSKVSRWFWTSFGLLVLSGSVFELYQFIEQVLSFSKLLAVPLIALGAVFVSSAFLAIYRAIRSKKHMSNRLRQKHQLQQFEQNQTFGQANKILTNVSDEISLQVDISNQTSSFHKICQPTHNDSELIELYSVNVLQPLDTESSQIISKHSSETALMVALSPLATLDMLLVAWRTSKMISDISSLYGCPQNVFTRLSLCKSVLKNLALVGAGELVADAGVELVGGSLTASVSAKAAQGIGVGLLISRLGIQTMQLCRPIEFKQENKPKLSDMRKVLVKTIAKKIGGSVKK